MTDAGRTPGLTSLPLAGESLPVAGPPLRSDAARNRERVLAAARRIVARDGACGLTMDAVAEEAGVGKGTVFRRFGDRASLMHALIDEDERRFQDAVFAGPPPLGPGAPPAVRLLAYGRAALEHLNLHREILAETDGQFSLDPHPVEVAVRMHVARLLRELGYDQQVATVTAAALQSFLYGPRIYRMRRVEHFSLADLQAGWATVAGGLIAAAPGAPPGAGDVAGTASTDILGT